MVYYNSQHNKYGTMIGKFDEESLTTHEEKFKTGKIPLSEAKVNKRDIVFTEIDCPAQQLEAMEDDDDFDDILQEILAEEKARREAEEDDDEDGGSKKKKKKKKKGKKKSNAKNDELWYALGNFLVVFISF